MGVGENKLEDIIMLYIYMFTDKIIGLILFSIVLDKHNINKYQH